MRKAAKLGGYRIPLMRHSVLAVVLRSVRFWRTDAESFNRATAATVLSVRQSRLRKRGRMISAGHAESRIVITTL